MSYAERIYAVIANFDALEKQLAACMEYIPFTKDNEHIVSPRFPPIILEACSLIESIFRLNVTDKKKHTISTYATLLEPTLDLHDTTTLFLAPTLSYLQPFREWTTITPSWWTAYNKLKHDRLGHHDVASYLATVSALAGLHQVITRSRAFIEVIVREGWVNKEDHHIADLMLCRAVGSGPPWMPAESKLFVSPISGNFVTWTNGTPTADNDWEYSWRVKAHLWEHDER